MAQKPKLPARTLDAAASFRDHPDAIVEAGEIVGMRFPSGGRMSLRAAKLFHLLIQFAGAKIADHMQHRVALATLNESFHTSADELVDLIDELHTTTLRMQLTDAKGRRYTKSGPILSDVEREEETDAQAEVRFEFSPAMRQAIANSTHWAVISRRAVLAFESRYALRLYTMLSLRAGLRKATEQFSEDDLRELLGVPSGKLKRWQDLKTWAIEPALAEVNHLTGLIAGYTPIKRGRQIVGVTLVWGVKAHDDRVAAMKELERPKVGRKSRRAGTTDDLVASDDMARVELAEALARVGRNGK